GVREDLPQHGGTFHEALTPSPGHLVGAGYGEGVGAAAWPRHSPWGKSSEVAADDPGEKLQRLEGIGDARTVVRNKQAEPLLWNERQRTAKELGTAPVPNHPVAFNRMLMESQGHARQAGRRRQLRPHHVRQRIGRNDSLAVEGAAVEKRKHETTKVSAAGRQ